MDILGPNPATFGTIGVIDSHGQARANWQSGRSTTPLSNSILYAPEGTPNVSATYYHDQIRSPHKRNNVIKVISGPAVEEMVYGNAWGMQADISCRVVHQDDLKLLRIRDWNEYGIFSLSRGPGEPVYYDLNSTYSTPYNGSVPSYINETGVNLGASLYSLIMATDPRVYGNSTFSYDPFNTSESWSRETVEGKLHLPPGRAPVTLLEAFLWQGAFKVGENDVLDDLLQNGSSWITKSSVNYDDIPDVVRGVEEDGQLIGLAGFAVQCEMQSAAANFILDPATRTYSDLTHGAVARVTVDDLGAEEYPIHLRAFDAVASHNELDNQFAPRDLQGTTRLG